MINIIPKPRKVEVLSNVTYKHSRYDIKREYDFSLNPNSYKLEINENGIFLFASDEAGFFYGAQTINQLAFEEDFPNILVEDEPRYEYRGYMLDCSRHFFKVEEIKKILDVLALLKFSVFHWHLTDDQGWRIDIARYPLLTKLGSSRPQTTGDGKEIKGYYTKKEIEDVVSYAKKLHINVLPEIDIPGHFSAAISAYPFLSCDGKSVNVQESFGIFKDVACAGKADTYKFIENVLLEVFELFPYKYIHLGGDEALRTKWLQCPDCQNTIAKNKLKNEDELQAYMMARIASFCKEHDKIVINWNDGMHAENSSSDIVLHFWREGAKDLEASKRHVKQGAKIIMSPFFKYYLDYPYGMTPLRKSFKFNPVQKWIEDPSCVLGVETPLWTEYVQNFDKIMYQTFPRLFVAAERGWSSWHKDYSDFERRAKYFSEKYLLPLGYNIPQFKEVNPIGPRRLVSLRKFYRQVHKPSAKAGWARVKENQKLLEQKYGKK